MSSYSPKEEKANIISHAVGLVLSIIALAFLVIKSNQIEGVLYVICAVIFGMSLVILYAASTLYHSSTDIEGRKKLRIFDHAAIYVLIAGSYTPFALVTFDNDMGWVIFSISWSAAFIGIVLKIFFTGKFNLLSTLMYVLMGSIVFIDMETLNNNLPEMGLQWLLIGGISYLLGAVIYSIKKIKFNHAIFHVFVLIGSYCHFMAVYYYVFSL